MGNEEPNHIDVDEDVMEEDLEGIAESLSADESVVRCVNAEKAPRGESVSNLSRGTSANRLDRFPTPSSVKNIEGPIAGTSHQLPSTSAANILQGPPPSVTEDG